MKAGDSKLCPSCGLRNKPKWEFCARCGESLQDVATGASDPIETLDEPVRAETAGPNWLSWAGIAAALAVSIFILVRWRPTQDTTDPTIFVSPQASQVTARSGAADVAAPASPSGFADGQSALLAGDIPTALAELARAVANTPGDPIARYAYAQALWRAGESAGALEQYRRASELSPESVNYHRDLARAYQALGRGAEAIPELEAALRIQPQSPAYMRDLAALYVQTGNTAGAIDLLTRASQLKTGDAQLLKDLGQVLERSGNRPAAAEAYRRVVSSDPKDATARALLSELVFGEGRQEEAIALVREGLAADAPASLYRALASLLERNGRTQEAAENYRAYAEKSGGAPDAAAMAERARILEQSGRS